MPTQRDKGCFNTRKPCEETKKRIDEVVSPVGVYSGMTKRVAIADGSHVPAQTIPRGKAKKG